MTHAKGRRNKSASLKRQIIETSVLYTKNHRISQHLIRRNFVVRNGMAFLIQERELNLHHFLLIGA